MKKNLLLSSLLVGSIFIHTGCMNKNFNHTSQTVIEPIVPHHAEVMQNTSIETPPISIEIPAITPSTISTPSINEENLQQIQTIQGKNIAVKITNTGFEFPEYRGKTVLLQIFGKNCSYCFEEMTVINKIKEEYGTQLQIIAIQGQEPMSQSEASTLIGRYKMNYPIIEKDNASDLIVFLRDKYEWTGVLPYVLLIKDSSMQYSATDYETLKENINAL